MPKDNEKDLKGQLKGDKENAEEMFKKVLHTLIRLMTVTLSGEGYKKPLLNQSSNQSAVNTNYSPVTGGKTVNSVSLNDQNRISISDLMKKNGVSAQDFQAICNQYPDLAFDIGGGATCNRLANAATKVKAKSSSHSCLSGVRGIYQRANIASLNCAKAQRALLKSRKPYQNNNGGGNAYEALNASGDYLVVSIKNTAYGKGKSSPENKALNAQIQNINPGVTLTVDSISNDRDRIAAGNTPGGIFGHIAVKGNDQKWGSDFKQSTVNFARYGENIRFCFPKDATVSPEFAQLLIEQARLRQQSQQIAMSATQTNARN